eukprot:468916_1
MTSNERKQRTIKNSIVNIDNVSIDRGDDYVNWIHIVKQKLLEREISLLQQRREVCDAIIVSMIKMFATHHAEIFDKYNQDAYAMETTATQIYQQQLQSQITDVHSPLIVRYIRSIHQGLTTWNGYHPKMGHLAGISKLSIINCFILNRMRW